MRFKSVTTVLDDGSHRLQEWVTQGGTTHKHLEFLLKERNRIGKSMNSQGGIMTLKKCIAMCAVLAIASTAVVAQQREGSGTMGGDKAMEAWMKAATPGEHHKHLSKSVGSWTYEGKMWMQPGQRTGPSMD